MTKPRGLVPSYATIKADHHHAIRRDKQRQFQRECDGRHTWDHQMPLPPRVAKEMTRQERRLQERLDAKERAQSNKIAIQARKAYRAKRKKVKRAVERASAANRASAAHQSITLEVPE